MKTFAQNSNDKTTRVQPSVAERQARVAQQSNGLVGEHPQTQVQAAVQRMADASSRANRIAQLQGMADGARPNRTGLPDGLKAGIENLSGYSMDDVKVHYNSDKPATLQAHAYAQGTDIHLAPGQEKHLPHEAWHVIQQKQGRVRPTMQMKGGVNVNDDAGLEKEADVMGTKGSRMVQIPYTLEVEQRSDDQPVVQKITNNGGKTSTKHLEVGVFHQADTGREDGAFGENVPVIIEVNEMTVLSAKTKIDSYAKGNTKTAIPVVFVVGINEKLDKTKPDQKVILDEKAKEIASHLELNGIEGGCFSFAWEPTGDVEGGYTFPFLEARSLLTLHDGVAKMHDRISKLTSSNPVVRSMDGDVTSDPLFSGGSSLYAEEQLVEEIHELSEGTIHVVSGGYRWNPDDVETRLRALEIRSPAAEIVDHIKTIINIVNKHELRVRMELNEQFTTHSIYWPEPNTYMTLHARIAGAKGMKDDPSIHRNQSQQKESTHYLKEAHVSKGSFNPELVVVKPMKNYLDDLLKLLFRSFEIKRSISLNEIKDHILAIRQTHLNSSAISDNYKWTGKKMDFENIKAAKAICEKHLDLCAKDVKSMIADLSESV